MQYLLSEDEYENLKAKATGCLKTIEMDQGFINYIKRIPNCGPVIAQSLLDALTKDGITLNMPLEKNWSTQYLNESKVEETK